MSELRVMRRLIATARRKIRLQYALDGVTLGLAVGLFGVTVVLALSKAAILGPDLTLGFALCAAGPLAGLVWAYVHRIDAISVAAAIDRANGFHDRLSSAYEFAQEPELTPFMRAQIADTMKRIDQLDAGKAHVLRRPKDIMAVVVFAASALLIVAVQFPAAPVKGDRAPMPLPVVIEEEPEIRTNLDPGLATFRKDQVEELLEVAEKADNDKAREAAEELRELLEEDQRGEVTPEQFNQRLEAVAQKLQSNCENVDYGALLASLRPLSPKFADDGFAEPLRSAIEGKKFDAAIQALDALADKVVEEGALTASLTPEQFYKKVDAAVEEHLICEAEELEKVSDALEEAAATLAKDPETKELAEALEKGDQDAAASAIEKLAEKIANGDLSEKDIEKLAKLLEKFADKLDLNDPKLAEKFAKYKSLADKLEKKMKGKKGGISKKEQKQLDDARKQLSRLNRQKEQEERGESNRRLKRLEKQSRQAADELRKMAQQNKAGEKGDKKPEGEKGQQKDGADEKVAKDQEGEKGDKGDEKSDTGNAADELRKLNRDREGKKAEDDLREASKRMKEDAQRNQGAKKKKSDIDNDERANRIDDYLKRAKGQPPPQQDKPGQKGDKGGNKDGEKGDKDGEEGGKKSGEGGDKQAENSQEKGGEKYGKGHVEADGADTDLDSKRIDTDLKGQKGAGPSRAEVIKKASQSGFANRTYKEAYEEYEKAVEEVLEQEKVPPGYRHYVRRYFDFIRPQKDSDG